MEIQRRKEVEEVEFGTLLQVTEWVLDKLDEINRKPFWRRESKYQEARRALEENNWIPCQKIVEQEYESSEGVLETGRINIALLHPYGQVEATAPIVRHTVFWGILLQLINQRVELAGDTTFHRKAKNTIQKVGIAICTMEYQKDMSFYSVPRLLKELQSLASGMFE